MAYGSNPGARVKTIVRRATAAVLALGAAALATGTALAQTGYIGILGGGPIYEHNPAYVKELKTSGFTEVIVWSVEVSASGDLNLNGNFPLTSNGQYIGAQTWPDFAQDLQSMKKGKVKRITLSIGSSNYGDWENIEALVDSQGTGPSSILYQDFAALAAALPIDAIDFDDENGYDAPSTTAFALMLGGLGFHVTINPYTNNTYWTSLVSGINSQSPGLVDGVHLQVYAGGAGNDPCSNDWNFGSVPVYPGLSDQTGAPPYSSPKEAKQRLERWYDQCQITGAWLWIFDQIAGTDEVKQYAKDMTKGVGGADEHE